MKRIKTLLALMVVAVMLSGCDKKTEKVDEKTFIAARNDALRAADPYLALAAFTDRIGAYGEYCQKGSLSGTAREATPEEFRACDQRTQAYMAILKKSLDAGSVPALLFLFDPYAKMPQVYPDDYDRTYAAEQLNRLVRLADDAPATQENVQLLMLAGKTLQTGKYADQDSRKAITMYVKAWQAGSSQAAPALADIYHFLQDGPRTYFWQIRSRDTSSAGELNLTKAQIVEVQQLAADSSHSDL